MANPEHLSILREGAESWNTWREQNPRVEADLTECSLKGLDLSGAHIGIANLTSSDLYGTRLTRSDLERARLTLANLSSADLVEARLHRAHLRFTNLKGANLQGAQLNWAEFQSGRLDDADLTAAVVGGTVFADTDLSTVKGLDKVRHEGPSTLGVDTIYQSKGKIPEKFLRGCGLPEGFIAYARSLATSPIEFYSCFISYSTKDQDFAERLHADLQDKGVRCWFAPHDVQGGRKLHEQIDEAIRLHDKLLLILSPHSMESEWVKTEIANARKREVRDQRRVMFPVRLTSYEEVRDWECFDADTGKDSAREIREYFIPDFSDWKDHDSYREAFLALLRDLKSQDPKPKGD